MMPRLGFILIFFIILSGCSESTPERATDVVATPKVNTPKSDGEEEAVSVVCGVLYQVNDFEAWFEAYKGVASGTIIVLRNVDDPSLVLVYEGQETLDLVMARGTQLTSEMFLKSAGIENSPIVSNYTVQFYSPPATDFRQHVALIFESPDIGLVIERLQRDSDLFAQYGLTVLGVGTNLENEEEVYVLLTLEDFVSFRQTTNSPRKIRNFIESINLPAETLISDWTETLL